MEELLFHNVLVNNIENRGNYINPSLFYFLTPEEFYIYHFLANAPETFVPSYEALGSLLTGKSKSSINLAVKRLKELGLLEVERYEGVWLWTVREQVVEEIPERIEKVKLTTKKTSLKEQTDIEKEISILEERLGYMEDPIEIDKIFQEIIRLRMKGGRRG